VKSIENASNPSSNFLRDLQQYWTDGNGCALELIGQRIGFPGREGFSRQVDVFCQHHRHLPDFQITVVIHALTPES
jgi:hypothetical protein